MKCVRILVSIMYIGFALPNPLSGMKHTGSPHSILEGLNLTHKQKKEIASLRKDYPLKSLHFHVRSSRQKLHKLIRSSNSSDRELQKIHEELIVKEIISMRRRFRFMMRLRKILTRQQLETFHGKMQRISGKNFHGDKRF